MVSWKRFHVNLVHVLHLKYRSSMSFEWLRNDVGVTIRPPWLCRRHLNTRYMEPAPSHSMSPFPQMKKAKFIKLRSRQVEFSLLPIFAWLQQTKLIVCWLFMLAIVMWIFFVVCGWLPCEFASFSTPFHPQLHSLRGSSRNHLNTRQCVPHTHHLNTAKCSHTNHRTSAVGRIYLW